MHPKSSDLRVDISDITLQSINAWMRLEAQNLGSSEPILALGVAAAVDRVYTDGSMSVLTGVGDSV